MLAALVSLRVFKSEFHLDLETSSDGISGLSSIFLIGPPNSNTLEFLILVIKDFTAASGLVRSGSFVTKRNSAKRGLTSPRRFILNFGIKHQSFRHLVLEIISFLLSRPSGPTPYGRTGRDPLYPSLKFPVPPILSSVH